MNDSSAISEKLPNESDNQHFAYCCWRDLPPPRTIDAAWAVYRAAKHKNSRKPSGDWYKWRKEYKWDERTAAFDAQLKEQFREAAIALNSEDFFTSLEDYRQSLKSAERNLRMTASVSLLVNAIEARFIQQKVMDRSGKIIGRADKADRALLLELTKSDQIAAANLEASRGIFNEVHYLDGVGEALSNRSTDAKT